MKDPTADSEAHSRNLPALRRASSALRRMPYVVVGAALGALLFIGGLWWSELEQSFPQLESGAYLGEIDPGEDSEPVRIYVEYNAQANALFIVPLRAGWGAQTVYVTHRPGIRSVGLDAVTIRGDGTTLRLVGAANGSGRYSGSAYVSTSGRSGAWHLQRITPRDDQAAPSSVGEERKAFSFVAELVSAERTVGRLSRELIETRQESERLAAYLLEGDAVAKDTEREMRAAESERAAAEEQLRGLRARATQLAEQVAVSEKLAGAGRLVALSRETLDREGRWITSMLRAGGENNQQIEGDLQRAEEIAALNEEIQGERERIAELRTRALAKQPSESRPFDSFWKGETP